MAVLLSSIVDFLFSIIAYWWALVPGVLLGLGEVMTFFSEKVDEWFKNNKLRVRRYAIPISIIGLFIACFLAFHEERMAHEDTKNEFIGYKDKYSTLEFDELRSEINNVREEIHKWPTEGSIDGDVGIGQWEGNVFVYHQPLLVFTKMVTWEESLKPFIFTIDGEGAPPPNTFIYWRIDADRAKNRVKATIDGPLGNMAEVFLNMKRSTDAGFNSGIQLTEDRRMSLVAKLDEGTVPVILRVYITSYEVENK